MNRLRDSTRRSPSPTIMCWFSPHRRRRCRLTNNPGCRWAAQINWLSHPPTIHPPTHPPTRSPAHSLALSLPHSTHDQRYYSSTTYNPHSPRPRFVSGYSSSYCGYHYWQFLVLFSSWVPVSIGAAKLKMQSATPRSANWRATTKKPAIATRRPAPRWDCRPGISCSKLN